MRVMVQVTEASRARSAGGGVPPELGDVAQQEGVAFEALHEGAQGDTLGSWFTVVVDAPAIAERLVANARTCPGVEAAYIEPPTGPPG